MIVLKSLLRRSPVLRAALFVGIASACNDACPVEEWSAPDWDANTAEAIALREQLNTVGTAMRETEQGTRALDTAALAQAFQSGTPSLQEITSPQFQPIATDATTEFVELAQVGPVDLVDASGAWAPGAQGGIFGSSSRGINEGGIEVRQIVDKGLFAGGGFYRYAARLTAGEITPATVEAIAAIFGTGAELSTTELTDSATYANSTGFFDEVSGGLTAAHAHAGDDACSMEGDEALVAAFRSWELAMFSRFVFYANEAHAAVAAGVTDDNVATASHELSEGLGLVLGFYGLDAPASGPLASGVRVVSDADIERMMTALGVNIGDLGMSTTGQLLVDPTALESGVREVEAAVAAAFGLSAAEVEAFRTEVAGE